MNTRCALPTLLVALAALLGPGCATYARVKRLRPAEIAVQKGQRVAFVPLGGSDGRNLQGALEQQLTRGGFFQLVDRANMDAILREQRSVVQGTARDDGNVKVGELSAAGALINGEATAQGRETRRRTDDTCASYDARLKKMVSRPCTLHTVETTVEYTGRLSYVDTSTGEIKTTRPFQRRRSQSASAHDSMPAAVPAQPLVEACRREVADEFMKVIAPYEVHEEVLLVSDGKLPQLQAGNKFALVGNWQQAAQFYGQAAQLVSGGAVAVGDPQVQAKAYYALGLALAMQGDFQRGMEFLNRATGMDPNDDYVGLTARASEWARDSEKLAQEAAPVGASEP